MAVRLEDYVAVEEGVANWLYAYWYAAFAPLMPHIVKAIEAKDYDAAWKIVHGVDVQSIAQKVEKGLENHVVVALTFGAMLKKQSNKIIYTDHALPPIVPNVVKLYQASLLRIQRVVLETLVAFFQTHEPVHKHEHEHCGCLDELAVLLLKSAKLSNADKLNAVVMGQARSAIDVAANLNTSRLVQLGYLQQSYVDGVTTYEITEVMDGRTCGVCRSMNGQQFQTTDGISRLMSLLQITDPDSMKAAAPFPSQSADNVAALSKASSSQLTAMGLQSPPYHPGCRGMTVPVGTVQVAVTTEVPSVEQFESIFAGASEDLSGQNVASADHAEIDGVISGHIEKGRDLLVERYGEDAVKKWETAGKLPQEVLTWLQAALAKQESQ